MDQQYSATAKHWMMLNVQNVHHCPQGMPSSWMNRLINDRLSVNQALPRLINISHRMLIDPLL